MNTTQIRSILLAGIRVTKREALQAFPEAELCFYTYTDSNGVLVQTAEHRATAVLQYDAYLAERQSL